MSFARTKMLYDRMGELGGQVSFEPVRATTVTPRLRTTTELASQLHHRHTLPACNSPIPAGTWRDGQPNSSTLLAPQPTHHNPHFTTPNPFPHQHSSHIPPTPNRHPTLPPKPVRTGDSASRPNTASNYR